MVKHQIHFGRKFYQDKKTGYWISTDGTSQKKRCRAHQWVWICTHKIIPKGYHIHHINDDKSDNRIENLELIHASRHTRMHMQEKMKCPEIKKRVQENCEKIRPLTKKWHASPEGREWHRKHGIQAWLNRKEIEIQCSVCGKTAKTKTHHQVFCSNACKSKWRRASGLDNVEKKCKECREKFLNSKYSKNIFCSRRCAQRYRTTKAQGV